MTKNNILAFDFGTKNIGVAIGQNITYTAHPLMTFKACNGVPNWKKLKELFDEWKPEIVVIGLSLNINGNEQPISTQTRRFANQLQNRFNIRIILHDERFSTVEARAYLFKHGGYRMLKKNQIDMQAAVIILESWFQQFLNTHSR